MKKKLRLKKLQKQHQVKLLYIQMVPVLEIQVPVVGVVLF